MNRTRNHCSIVAVVLALSFMGAAVAPRPIASFPSNVHRSVQSEFARGDDTIAAWVFFADKTDNPGRAIDELARTYHSRAIERRRARRTAPGLFDERDLPVRAAYLESIERLGAERRTVSRWLNAVSVEATAEQIRRIAQLEFVTGIQPVRHGARSGVARPGIGQESSRPTGVISPKAAVGLGYGPSLAQLQLINLVALHTEGYTGQGVVIGVLDTGFKRTHDAFTLVADPIDIVAEHDFVNDDGNTAPEAGDLGNQHDHGTLVLGVMGAYEPSVLVGGAYDAAFILAKVENLAFENTSEEDLFVAGLEFIEANGGDVATSSVVIFNQYTQAQLDGLTSVMTLGLNAATDNGLHCFQGAGNEGHDADPATSALVPPADAFDAISVGAVDINGDLAWFSSDGPTADGRVKPEILSMGVSTITTDSFDDGLIVGVNGTSFATPLAAAAAACIVQKHPEWTVRQLRSALFQTANWYTATGTFDPQYVWGYGMMDAHAASNFVPPVTDLNEDFSVNVPDLLELLNTWGPCPTTGGCRADFNGDGAVNVPDLLQMLGEWG